ncbi:MAG: iron transporter [Desulfobacterales bacterium C00003060]|nr:MAG: iron transporter [Desulfobacterales bacterium C00003060]
MQNTNNKLRLSLTSGLAKGWSGFAWMLKILLPISLLTSLLAWSGWINRLDFILEPVMGVIGLPPMAALPLIAGLLTGIYGAIAAMVPLPLTVDQMTLLAIFLVISHNLIQEGVVQSKSGLPFLKATLFRLIASILTVMVVSRFMGHETATNALTDAPVIIQAPFFSMLKTWTVATLFLSAKILVIIMSIMIILEIMKSYNLIDRIVRVMAPVLKALGLGTQTGFLWLTAATFGLTYGAAVIVEEAKEGNFSKDELERLHLSIGINHSMVEDPALFLSLGLGLFWLCVPRLAAAIIAVQLLIIFKRLISLPGFSRFSL